MLALTGLGASVENAVIAARQFGIEPTVVADDVKSGQLRPIADSAGEPLLRIATLSLVESGSPDALHPQLASRCTCRRMDRRRVEPEFLARLKSCVADDAGVRLDWLTDPLEIAGVAALVGNGNRIRFEHEPFHRELYENMRFSAAEVKRTRDGLDVATLQLPPGVGRVLRLLRTWPRMRTANLVGFSRAVGRQAAAEVRGSGAIGILTVDRPETDAFLEGGRAFGRIWLSATSLGLALHPTASLPVFLAHAERTDMSQLQPRHSRMAQYMLDEFYRLCPILRGRTVQMVFRLGYGPRPKVRSLRRSVSDVLE
jgi:hypothetical protein